MIPPEGRATLTELRGTCSSLEGLLRYVLMPLASHFPTTQFFSFLSVALTAVGLKGYSSAGKGSFPLKSFFRTELDRCLRGLLVGRVSNYGNGS